MTIAARALPEVHVDLGPSKFVSRLHAEIFYDGEDTASWHIRVNGRNGVRLNNAILKRGTDAVLSCGDIIEMANTQMMFVTPGDKANIHPSFVERAHRLANGEEELPVTWDAMHHVHPANAPTADPTQQPPASSSLNDDYVPPRVQRPAVACSCAAVFETPGDTTAPITRYHGRANGQAVPAVQPGYDDGEYRGYRLQQRRSQGLEAAV